MKPGRRLSRLRDVALITLEYALDCTRYVKRSGPSDAVARPGITGMNLEAQLTKDYHRIEKGLALPKPRQPFGHTVETRLHEFRGAGQSTDSVSAPSCYVDSALEALERWNGRGEIDDAVAPFGKTWDPGQADTSDFFATRHSVRNFDTDCDVAQSDIHASIKDAMCSPSVCNRQAARLRIYRGDTARGVLKLQAGSAGFADSVPYVAVVSVDQRLFTGAGERNQGWVDGGLFAMTFVWALHSRGISSCMLNWSKRNVHSARLRRLIDVPSSEDFICVIAFGRAAPDHRVARSPRRPADQVAPHVEM